MKIITITDEKGKVENKIVSFEITEFLTIFKTVNGGSARCDCCSTDLAKHSKKVYMTFANWSYCDECFKAITKNKIVVFSGEDYEKGDICDGLFSLQNVKTGEFFEDKIEYTKKIFCCICGDIVHIKNNMTDLPLCPIHTQILFDTKDISTQQEFLNLLRYLRNSICFSDMEDLFLH